VNEGIGGGIVMFARRPFILPGLKQLSDGLEWLPCNVKHKP